MSGMAAKAAALALLLGEVAAWETYHNGFKADQDRPQETQTSEQICGGVIQPAAEGCNVAQSVAAGRTWEGIWDYIPVAGGYPQGPKVTPKKEGLIDGMDNGFPVVCWVYFGLYALVMLVWILMKTQNKVESKDSEDTQGSLKLTGYKSSTFGKICFGVYHSMTAAWFILYFTLIFDTYWECEVSGPDNLCFKGAKPILGGGKYPDDFPGQLSPNVNQNVFFCLWCLGMAWALFNFFYGGGMPNFFRTKCKFSEATNVLCAHKSEKIVMSNPTWWVRQSRAMAKCMGSEDVWFVFTSEVVPGTMKAPTFLFMCAQFALEGGKFVKADQPLASYKFADLKKAAGLTDAESKEILAKVGKNVISFEPDSWPKLITDEVCTYLYMYQFTFFMVWLWFGGLIWCSPQMVVVVVCASMSIAITRANQLKIQEISTSGGDGTATVARGVANWDENVDAADLAPGDKVQLKSDGNDYTLPCDMVVVSGGCLVDESGLTGESMPVRKTSGPNETVYDSKDGSHNKYTLYAGTVLQQADTGTVAIVSQTAIRTAKGDLVSNILYPASMVFQYDEELRVVFSFLSVYATVLFFISVWLQMKISPLTWVAVFAFACFTISQILPPLLAVALVIGHTKSANRLGDKGILCVQPKRIAISGKIHAFMFDKTGTLTQQGLTLTGVDVGCKSENVAAYTGAGTSDTDKKVNNAMGTCHTLGMMKGELVGNHVEVEMFKGSGWELDSDCATVTLKGEKLTIVKAYDFDHITMTMSVIVKDKDGNHSVYCKGAPRTIADLSTSGVPTDFDTVSEAHASRGNYCIGVGCKVLGKKTEAEVLAMNRGSIESGLEFLAVMLFRNELKSDTAEAIKMIKDGDVRPVMVTGDIAECGWYIGKECGMIADGINVYKSNINGDTISWTNMDPSKDDHDPSKAVSTEDVLLKENTELAITGDAMKVLGPQGCNDLLLKTRIFARVKPQQKVDVVNMYIDQGFITGMCGDGGNDCGALRAAHAGIALSEAEASVVSPFTSKKRDVGGQEIQSVMAVVDVLCEGRCALVTSFAAYRFYITYGLNWSIVKTINFVYGVRMPIIAYLTIDSVCSWLCAWAITGALPLDKLSKHRPTSSLFAPNIFWSVIGPWIVNMLLMTLYLKYEGDHVDHVDMQPQLSKGVGYWELGDTWESTVFTYFQVCPLIFCGVCYSLGGKFRQSLFTNYGMLLVWGIIFFIYALVLLLEPGGFTSFFHICSNAHNGFNTDSPVWMRYQFPLGCPDGESTAAYNASVGLGSWRAELPTNCEQIAYRGGACGPACTGATESCTLKPEFAHSHCDAVVLGCLGDGDELGSDGVAKCVDAYTSTETACGKVDGCHYTAARVAHVAGMPTPGMKGGMRFVLLLFIVGGMAFMMGLEMLLNHMYVTPADWESELANEEVLNKQKEAENARP